MRAIRVHPDLGVWIVDMCGERKVFVSGSEAERYARDRAREIVNSGVAALVRVYDLSLRLIAELRYGADRVLS